MRAASPVHTVTVFGSSRPSQGHPHYALALELGSQLASRGFVVCSGGYGGVMEAVSRGAKEAGGRTVGITTEFFVSRANAWLDEIISVKTWQERLFALIDRGLGYVACPGGTGTLVELSIVWEMINKRVMAAKPFVTVGNFWKPIVDCVREVETGHATTWGEAAAPIIFDAGSPTRAAEYLASVLSKSACGR